jgi:hypothetical protein
MPLKLYRVLPEGREHLFIAARTADQAAEIFVGSEIAAERQLGDFSVERWDRLLPVERRAGLKDMLAHEVTGLATHDDKLGWTVEPSS